MDAPETAPENALSRPSRGSHRQARPSRQPSRHATAPRSRWFHWPSFLIGSLSGVAFVFVVVFAIAAISVAVETTDTPAASEPVVADSGSAGVTGPRAGAVESNLKEPQREELAPSGVVPRSPSDSAFIEALERADSYPPWQQIVGEQRAREVEELGNWQKRHDPDTAYYAACTLALLRLELEGWSFAGPHNSSVRPHSEHGYVVDTGLVPPGGDRLSGWLDYPLRIDLFWMPPAANDLPGSNGWFLVDLESRRWQDALTRRTEREE